MRANSQRLWNRSRGPNFFDEAFPRRADVVHVLPRRISYEAG